MAQRIASMREHLLRNEGCQHSPGCRATSHMQLQGRLASHRRASVTRSRTHGVMAAVKRHQDRQCSAQPDPQCSQPSNWAGAITERLQQHTVAVRGTLLAAALSATLLSGAGPVVAADAAKVGTCLLGNCQKELALCLADLKCAENLICLQKCNGRPDEAACQIRCGDLYEDQAVTTFNSCAVSAKKCVPQKIDEGLYPVPNDCALDNSFDLSKFTGRWYITAGQNPLFDIFDCQEHFFGVPEPGKLYGKINWRINKGDDDFIERSTVQTFKQDPEKPAILRNHDNDYLHYEDDWYIIASKPDEYAFIYYKGNNDAWKGYGGATVYTRAAHLPDEYIPELTAAAEKVGMKWSDFTVTDNTCKPHPPPKDVIQEAEKFAEREAQEFEKFAEQQSTEVERLAQDGKLLEELEYNIEQDLQSFGKGFTILEKRLVDGLSNEEKALQSEAIKELEEARKYLDDLERQSRVPSWLQALPFKLPWFSN